MASSLSAKNYREQGSTISYPLSKKRKKRAIKAEITGLGNSLSTTPALEDDK